MKAIAAATAMPDQTARPAREDPLAPERRAFLRQRSQLLKRHRGEYVVIHGGRVVAHSPDDEALAARMFAKLGNEPFYIAHVDEAPVEIPSPELAR
jgi:hypothetical protein